MDYKEQDCVQGALKKDASPTNIGPPQAQEAAVPHNLICCCPVILILYTVYGTQASIGKTLTLKLRSNVVIIDMVRVSFNCRPHFTSTFCCQIYHEKERDRC